VFVGVAGGAAAYLSYRRPQTSWQKFEDGFEPLWGTWEDAYRVDDVYGAILVAPGKRLSEWAAFGFDLPIIDGAVNGVGRLFTNLGEKARPLQSGYVRNYSALFLGGTIIVVIWLLAGGT
jgi:NADH:ubiquinone oxidoreductase subunit 5 (subunit L)/multisubunit Na+/H+ antiporter MnhA subunit